MQLRQATQDDIPFLIEAVLAAETLPNGRVLYEVLFSLTRPELEAHLRTLLAVAGGASQLSFEAFWILQTSEGPCATCAAWQEAKTGAASGLLIASAWSRVLGPEKWAASLANLRAIAAAHLPRTPLALQLETFYVPPQFRGKQLTVRLIEAVTARFRAQGTYPRAEIEFLQENQAAAQAYKGAGFTEETDRPASAEFAVLTGSCGFRRVTRLAAESTKS